MKVIRWVEYDFDPYNHMYDINKPNVYEVPYTELDMDILKERENTGAIKKGSITLIELPDLPASISVEELIDMMARAFRDGVNSI